MSRSVVSLLLAVCALSCLLSAVTWPAGVAASQLYAAAPPTQASTTYAFIMDDTHADNQQHQFIEAQAVDSMEATQSDHIMLEHGSEGEVEIVGESEAEAEQGMEGQVKQKRIGNFFKNIGQGARALAGKAVAFAAPILSTALNAAAPGLGAAASDLISRGAAALSDRLNRVSQRFAPPGAPADPAAAPAAATDPAAAPVDPAAAPAAEQIPAAVAPVAPAPESVAPPAAPLFDPIAAQNAAIAAANAAAAPPETAQVVIPTAAPAPAGPPEGTVLQEATPGMPQVIQGPSPPARVVHINVPVRVNIPVRVPVPIPYAVPQPPPPPQLIYVPTQHVQTPLPAPLPPQREAPYHPQKRLQLAWPLWNPYLTGCTGAGCNKDTSAGQMARVGTQARFAQKSRRTRAAQRLDTNPGLGANPVPPIANPAARPAGVTPSSGAELNSQPRCSIEGRRRVYMCIRLLGAMFQPDANNQIRVDEASALHSCRDPKRSAWLKSGSARQTCEAMQGHILSVATLRQLSQAMRSEDPHQTCVKLLATAVDNDGQTWLSVQDSKSCQLSQSNNQNEGVIGHRCLFLTGSGVARIKYENAFTNSGKYDGLLPSYPAYWSAIDAAVAGRCDARYFITDTTHRGWDEPSLQREVCAAIATFQPHTLVAHSTANLIVAAGIANGVAGCDRIALAGAAPKVGESVWISLNSPLDGSPLVSFLNQQCSKIDTTAPKWYAGVCARDEAAPYAGFAAIEPQFINKHMLSPNGDVRAYGRAQINCRSDAIVSHFSARDSILNKCVSLRSVAEKYQSAAMCGVAPDSIGSSKKYSKRSTTNFLNDASTQASIAWGDDRETRYLSHKLSGNDGLVPYSSCTLGNRRFERTSHAAFYATMSNHNDARGVERDSRTLVSKQPTAWLVGRIDASFVAHRRLQKFQSRSAQDEPHPHTSSLEKTDLDSRNPDYSTYKYDAHAIEEYVREQLAADDALALSGNTRVGGGVNAGDYEPKVTKAREAAHALAAKPKPTEEQQRLAGEKAAAEARAAAASRDRIATQKLASLANLRQYTNNAIKPVAEPAEPNANVGGPSPGREAQGDELTDLYNIRLVELSSTAADLVSAEEAQQHRDALIEHDANLAAEYESLIELLAEPLATATTTAPTTPAKTVLPIIDNSGSASEAPKANLSQFKVKAAIEENLQVDATQTSEIALVQTAQQMQQHSEYEMH